MSVLPGLNLLLPTAEEEQLPHPERKKTMTPQKLSIIIPAFNESLTLPCVLDKINAARLPAGIGREVVVVDDGSTDATPAAVAASIAAHPELEIRLVRHEVNRGKGAALRSGISHAAGDYLVIQDADLEYDPGEYAELLKPVIDGHADVVYGSRFMGSKAHRILFFWHTIGNRFLTTLSNLCTNLNLTDMETGYKLFRTGLIKGIALREQRFGFEPEVTAKIARIPRIRIYEIGISYYGRTYEEGKKINWRDGLHAIWCILKYGLFRR